MPVTLCGGTSRQYPTYQHIENRGQKVLKMTQKQVCATILGQCKLEESLWNGLVKGVQTDHPGGRTPPHVRISCSLKRGGGTPF